MTETFEKGLRRQCDFHLCYQGQIIMGFLPLWPIEEKWYNSNYIDCLITIKNGGKERKRALRIHFNQLFVGLVNCQFLYVHTMEWYAVPIKSHFWKILNDNWQSYDIILNVKKGCKTLFTVWSHEEGKTFKELYKMMGYLCDWNIFFLFLMLMYFPNSPYQNFFCLSIRKIKTIIF